MYSMGMFFTGLLFFIITLLITAAILRWFFRINDIIKRLDDIVRLLEVKKI